MVLESSMLNRQNGREEQIRVTYIIRSLGMPLPQHLSIERPVLRPGKHPVHFSGVSSYWRTSILRSSQNPVIVESPHTALLCSTIHSGFQRRTVLATILQAGKGPSSHCIIPGGSLSCSSRHFHGVQMALSSEII